MALEAGAAFHYVVTVPEGVMKRSPWQMKSAESFRPTVDSLGDRPLVGWEPLLHISDAAMTTNPSASRPAVLRSEIRLVATDKKYDASETASYFVDRVLLRVLRPGDVFHIAGTCCGGVGASAIRGGKLVFAVGAVVAVPLGSQISMKIPYESLRKAEEILRQRDPEFEFLDYPIEICIGGRPKILYCGHLQMGGYHVWVEHGFLLGLPGTDESVSITCDEVCDWVAGSASAKLLALP